MHDKDPLSNQEEESCAHLRLHEYLRYEKEPVASVCFSLEAHQPPSLVDRLETTAVAAG